MDQKFGESEDGIPWIDDYSINESTSYPEVLEENVTHLTTVIIFVITAIFMITLLFVIAIFIDCRQQKLMNLTSKKPKRLIRIKRVPLRKNVPEDQDTIVDKMEEGCSSSNVIV